MESVGDDQAASSDVPTAIRRHGRGACRRQLRLARGAGAVRAGTTDAFFRHIVSGMRNGVLAITRDGTSGADQRRGLPHFRRRRRSRTTSASPLPTCLRDHPDVVRVLAGAFDLHHLPNRAEMRLKPSNKVIGYTLALVRDDDGDGDRRGDVLQGSDARRAARRTRASARSARGASARWRRSSRTRSRTRWPASRSWPDCSVARCPMRPMRRSVLTDIISEAKMANAIVQEVLDFVRPIRLQVEHTSVAEAVQGAIQLADTKAQRGDVEVDGRRARRAAADPGRPAPAHAGVHQPADERLRGHGRQRDGSRSRPTCAARRRRRRARRRAHRVSRTTAPGSRPTWRTRSSTRSSRPSRRAPVLAWPSSGRSWTRTTDGSTCGRPPGQGTTIRVTLPVTGGNEE